ncbi:MAG TPA: hypothetical protein VFH15_14035 [Pyrinomonadaceae bacterium]|nr:hypothetical protein [Pyrinomonadaceae bacterium]
MSQSVAPRLYIEWRLGLIAAIAMSVLALVPQFHLWAVRSSNWQGTYVTFDFDEVAYASYLNALIDGRPRRNDPYTGRDFTAREPLPESLHSIQFVAAYALALPARALGLSTGATFVLVRALAAFASTLALFWLLVLITSDSRVAAAGAIVVLCLGGLAGEPYDAWRIISLRGTGETLPFLRRYVPALVFPLFFIFAGLVWQALRNGKKQSLVRPALLAGCVIGLLIFSYFFLWTAAVAWLFVVAVLWTSSSGLRDRNAILVLAIPAVCAAFALVPYGLLLNQRAATVDAAQLLMHSRAPLVSLPVVIGLLVLLALVIVVRSHRLQWRQPAVIFTASFALLPAITFNQQIVTGLLLQPVHYSRYIANYTGVLAAFLATVLICRGNHERLPATSFRNRMLFLIVLTVFGWAIVESSVRSARFGNHNASRDDAQRVAWRLRELAAAETAASNSAASVVFCSDLLLADTLPNTAPQPILWASHLFVFSGASTPENRERLYQQLYYSGVNEQDFAALAGRSSFLQLALFGWERMKEQPHIRAITDEDVRRETLLYAEYIGAFNAARAAAPPVGYLVTPAMGGPSLTNFDRWYERDSGERVGDYMLYRTRQRVVGSGLGKEGQGKAKEIYHFSFAISHFPFDQPSIHNLGTNFMDLNANCAVG